MAKTITEINEKIKQGQVVVLDAEEIIGYVQKHGIKKTAQQVDVVTMPPWIYALFRGFP